MIHLVAQNIAFPPSPFLPRLVFLTNSDPALPLLIPSLLNIPIAISQFPFLLIHSINHSFNQSIIQSINHSINFLYTHIWNRFASPQIFISLNNSIPHHLSPQKSRWINSDRGCGMTGCGSSGSRNTIGTKPGTTPAVNPRTKPDGRRCHVRRMEFSGTCSR